MYPWINDPTAPRDLGLERQNEQDNHSQYPRPQRHLGR